jgi:hypothetical protein
MQKRSSPGALLRHRMPLLSEALAGIAPTRTQSVERERSGRHRKKRNRRVMASAITIQPPKEWGVIIAANFDRAEAAKAVARWLGNRPMANVHINGYGAIQATVWADREQLDEWFKNSLNYPHKSGDLCFFLNRTGGN